MAADDVKRLSDIEFEKLCQKLQNGLKRDIARIYSDSIFCDLELIVGSASLHVNCCVLQVRANRFYAQLRSLQKICTDGYELDSTVARRIKQFVKDIYEQNEVEAAETLLVKDLQKIAISPDFDQYTTPLVSPCEIFQGGNNLYSHQNTYPLYYSLVPLDWEKELEEQDFLIQSFRSIQNKEQKKAKADLLKSSSCSRLKRQKDSQSLQDLKKAVEEDCLLLQEEGALGLIDSRCLSNILSKELLLIKFHQVPGYKKSFESGVECGFFDAEDSSGFCNGSVAEMLRGISEKSKMSSTMDTGPDSGLATSAEDIPLDQESGLEASKSISSSVSSDCCVWDNTAPQHTNSNSWVDSAPHQDNAGIESDFVDRVLEELVGKSQEQKHHSLSGNVTDYYGGFAVMNAPKHHFFIDASSLLDETEIQPPVFAEGASSPEVNASACFVLKDTSIPEAHIIPSEHQETGQEESQFEHSDENESHQQIERSGKIADNSSHQNLALQAKKGQSYEEVAKKKPTEKTISLSDHSNPSGTCFDEDKPPSLIRSNTFELETEDDRLALLRQEYERRQGSLIFQRCVSQSSGPLSDVGSEQDQNQHCTSLILPSVDNSLSGANISMFLTHMVDDEIQTPDSLNSDVPETLSQDKSNVIKPEGIEFAPTKTSIGITDALKQDTTECVSSDSPLHVIKEVSSPLFSRRKTECAPILSGAAPPLSPEKKPVQKKVRNPLTGSFSSAWVVDISDITKSPETRRKKGDLLQGSSTELRAVEFKDHPVPFESRNISSGLGFFIDLKDSKSSLDDKFESIPSSEGSRISRQSSDSGKAEKQNACEFFVDLKQQDADAADRRHSSDASKDGHCPEKKLFSMFIDIGDKAAPKAKPDLTSRLKAPHSPFSSKRRSFSHGSHSEGINGKASSSESELRGGASDDIPSSPSHTSTNQTLDHKKNSFFMFIDSESASNRSAPSKNLVHHSGPDGKNNGTSRSKHVRASSLSFAKKCASSNYSELSCLSTTSRQLSTRSLHSSEMYNDDETGMTPMFSSLHVSLPLEESQKENNLKSQEEMVHEGSEVSSHKTVDSNDSSVCSLETYSVHTPEQSSATDDCSSGKKDYLKNPDDVRVGEDVENCSLAEGQGSSHSFTTEKAFLKGHNVKKAENKFKTDSKVTESFVRLSDLDKEPAVSSEQTIPTVVQRMSRSIPETSWIESKLLMSHSTGGGSATMSSSSRSLSRLFPHLSMCGGNIGRSKTSSTCSPLNGDLDTMRSSQASDISSMQSSAGLEYSTESTDLSDRGSPATQLGDDLLKMFLEEINTDVIVEVGGRRIKAHKCILSSRCQYFAAILSGGWVESAGNVISLQGFSYTCVHFALCHIYSGANTIPDQISIVELASLADLLSLEGLKDVIMYTLKVKYCHFFHKPCAVCSVGVLECLPLAAAYGLDDIYRRSLRWITKYFVRIWPTKTFTALPRELIEKCYQQHVIHMTSENVLETVLCCDKLLTTIPTVRWAEPVFVLTSRLLETCIKFISDNFSAVLTSENFLSLGRELPWNVSRFQETLTSACERMPPDQSCRSYSQLCSVLGAIEGPDPPPEMTWHPSFIELLVQLRDLSERTLIRQAVRAARTPGWGQMPSDLRRKIQDAACLVLAPADHASSWYKRSSSDGLRQNSQRSSYSRNLDLHQVKMAMVQHARRTNTIDHHHTINAVAVRKNVPSDRSTTVTRRSAPVTSSKLPEKSVTAPIQGRPKTWPAQVKSRYLEKRPNHVKKTIESEKNSKTTDAPVPQRRVPAPVKGIFISSSDSSRNSSPAMKRSSTISSASVKTGDSSSRTRATSVNVSSSSHVEASSLKEEGISKNASKVSRRSLSVHDKSYSVAKTSKNFTKIEDPPSIEFQSNGRMHSDSQFHEEEESSQKPSSLGSQSQNLTLSNDSLATVSSCDEINVTHSERDPKARSSTFSKTSPSKSALRNHTDIKKDEILRTPLSLANRKASPLNAQRKMPISSSKTHDINSIGSPHIPSLLPKRSVSQITKSPVLSTTSSRLAIPLRTSRSVSSVPDRSHAKANSFLGSSVSKKPTGRDQTRVTYTAPSQRASTGNTSVSSSSLAGKVSSTKSSKHSNSVGKTGNSKNLDKVNGDSSLNNIVHPTVGPRSGTFLKDEPTILKTPIAENN